MKKIVRMYYSREDRVADIGEESQRMQFRDGAEDADKVFGIFDTFASAVEALDEKVSDYEAALADNDAEEATRLRAEVIELWAGTQAGLSAVAWVMRFSGDVAFNRICDFAKDGTTYNMSDL